MSLIVVSKAGWIKIEIMLKALKRKSPMECLLKSIGLMNGHKVVEIVKYAWVFSLP